MNKMNKFFLMGTIALSGMTGLTACSSDDEVASNGDGNQTENGVVKTQFALNVPYSNNGTRMSAATVQEDKVYRGITKMQLYTFADAVSKDAKPTSKIELVTANAPTANANRTQLVYRDIEIPVETKNFVLYATATAPTDKNTKADIGSLQQTLVDANNAMSGVKVSLEQINSSTDFTSGDPKKLEEALNAVVTTQFTPKGGTATTWQAIATAAATATNPTPAEMQAKRLFDKFITLKAGSARSVRAALKSLKNQVDAIKTDNSIFAAISDMCTTQIENIKTNTFPESMGLPDGVVSVSYEDVTDETTSTTKKQFVYKNKSAEIFPGQTTGSTEDLINYADVTYPASLDYRVNTPAMVSDKLLSDLSEWPSYDSWSVNADATWTGKGFTEGAVASTTRSIGLKKAIEYAVAKLDFQVKATGSLKDAGEGTAQQTIALTRSAADGTVNNFEVKGILVGNQPKSVNWEYLPNEAEAGGKQFPYTVYDNKMNKTTYLTTTDFDTEASVHNYTLLLDNKSTGSTEEESVYVAIEMLNNSGVDFQGKTGIVPDQSMFYLVGKLVLNGKTLTGVENPHIFMQDYTTKARFTISSLQNAYNTIPDLRTSTLSLGMAVNLDWKTGLEFSVEIL